MYIMKKAKELLFPMATLIFCIATPRLFASPPNRVDQLVSQLGKEPFFSIVEMPFVEGKAFESASQQIIGIVEHGDGSLGFYPHTKEGGDPVNKQIGAIIVEYEYDSSWTVRISRYKNNALSVVETFVLLDRISKIMYPAMSHKSQGVGRLESYLQNGPERGNQGSIFGNVSDSELFEISKYGVEIDRLAMLHVLPVLQSDLLRQANSKSEPSKHFNKLIDLARFMERLEFLGIEGGSNFASLSFGQRNVPAWGFMVDTFKSFVSQYEINTPAFKSFDRLLLAIFDRFGHEGLLAQIVQEQVRQLSIDDFRDRVAKSMCDQSGSGLIPTCTLLSWQYKRRAIILRCKKDMSSN